MTVGLHLHGFFMNCSNGRRGEGRYLLMGLRSASLLTIETDCFRWDLDRVLGIVLTGWQADVDLDRHVAVGETNDARMDDGGAVECLLEDEMIVKN